MVQQRLNQESLQFSKGMEYSGLGHFVLLLSKEITYALLLEEVHDADLRSLLGNF